jgi:hypothetical protein
MQQLITKYSSMKQHFLMLTGSVGQDPDRAHGELLSLLLHIWGSNREAWKAKMEGMTGQNHLEASSLSCGG